MPCVFHNKYAEICEIPRWPDPLSGHSFETRLDGHLCLDVLDQEGRAGGTSPALCYEHIYVNIQKLFLLYHNVSKELSRC